MMSFIDEYCIYFDNEEENRFEYTQYHNVNILFNIIPNIGF
jgi:L-rhamnose mutarotase